MFYRSVASVLLAGLLLTLTACANGGSETGPSAAARAFQSSWKRQDGAALCGLLAPQTRSDVEQSAKKPCAEGILEEDLPIAGPPLVARVWGRAAQVQSQGDTLFLSRFPDGWKVTAAGCKPQAAQPYDCQVQGG